MQDKSEVNNQEEYTEDKQQEQGDGFVENNVTSDTAGEEQNSAGGTESVRNGGDDLAQQLETLQEELAETRNQLLRKHADFENFRKRMQKEKEDSIRYANQMLLLDLTDTIDNFERAMKSAEESKDFDAFHNGVVLIEKQLVSMLESKWGLKRFLSEGEAFDPEKHQAIAVEESSEYDTETVLEDFQKGYLYNDRVLRPAKVKVCKPVAGDESNTNNEE